MPKSPEPDVQLMTPGLQHLREGVYGMDGAQPPAQRQRLEAPPLGRAATSAAHLESALPEQPPGGRFHLLEDGHFVPGAAEPAQRYPTLAQLARCDDASLLRPLLLLLYKDFEDRHRQWQARTRDNHRLQQVLSLLEAHFHNETGRLEDMHDQSVTQGGLLADLMRDVAAAQAEILAEAHEGGEA